MKQIKISDKCDGCGLCIVKSKYIEENEEGNAQEIRGLAIKDNDLNDVEALIKECPNGAMYIIDVGVAKKAGVEGVREIIIDLKKKCEEIKIEKPKSKEYRFNVKNYDIPIPSTDKDYMYDYSSYNSAEAAAKDEFRKLCYSPSASKPMVKKIFVEYKVDKLKPYYNCEDQPDSYYYKYNEQVRKYLADAYAEINTVLSNNPLSSRWTEFSVYLSEKKSYYIEFLKKFDDISEEYDVISMIEKDTKDFSYPGIKHFLVNIECDSMDKYVGTDFFGNSKYKKKWKFTGFWDAAKEFVEEVYDQIGYRDDEIMDSACHYISGACEEFEKKIKEQFNLKIKELEQLILQYK